MGHLVGRLDPSSPRLSSDKGESNSPTSVIALAALRPSWGVDQSIAVLLRRSILDDGSGRDRLAERAWSDRLAFHWHGVALHIVPDSAAPAATVTCHGRKRTLP